MTKEEFTRKLNQKSIAQLADERIHAVLSNKQDIELLFRPYYDYFDRSDLKFLKSVITDTTTIFDSEANDPDKRLINLLGIVSTAKDAMRDLVVMMLHEMRDEDDFAGLAELHDAAMKLPYDLYLSLSVLIYNDLYESLDLYNQEGKYYQSFVKQFHSYFCGLRQRADDEWAKCQATATDDSVTVENVLSHEYLNELWQKHSALNDILLISTIEKREILALALLMLIEKILRTMLIDQVNTYRSGKEYNKIADMIQVLDTMEGLSSEKRKKCAGLLVSRSDN